MSTFETIRSSWPILVVAAGAISTAAVDNFRLNAMAEEASDISESVDENEEDIELIQRQLIQRQGQVELRTQRIEFEQSQQGEQLDEAILLLQQLLQQQQ